MCPTGSGKLSVTQTAIQEVVDRGGRALITAPTGKLAVTHREKFPTLDVDTGHGAFQVYKDLSETMELMIDAL